jgi:hypothetical protein
MFDRSWHMARWFVCALFCILALTGSQAQLVATRDLTQPRPPSPSSAQLGNYDGDYKVACNGSGVADGVQVDGDRDHIALSIVDAQSEMWNGQPRLKITVRLKNLNVYAPAEFPWEISPVVPIQTDPNDPAVKYEAATIWVWMATPKSSKGIASLRGEVNFWAQPNNPAHHLKLRPGEWVDIKLSVGVICDSIHEEVCTHYLNSDPMHLSAWWYERELTHARKGCIVTDSAYTSREFESSPFEFVAPLKPKPESSTPNAATSPKAN